MNVYEQQAARLKMLAHPLRLQILNTLRHGEECVCHLAAMLDKPQPYVSQQLAVLRNGGAILDHRDGTNIFYRLADENVLRQVEAACSLLPAAEPASGSHPLPGCCCPKCTDPTFKRG